MTVGSRPAAGGVCILSECHVSVTAGYAVCLPQVYYSLWRHLLKLFWWLVVAYTMLVLITIYTYQFEDFPVYWKNLTGFTDEQYVLHGRLWRLGLTDLQTGFRRSDLFPLGWRRSDWRRLICRSSSPAF